MTFFRSLVFNVSLVLLTLILGIIMYPSLWVSKKLTHIIIRFWHFLVYALEKNILGLDYKISGEKNIPRHGKSFLIAMEHQSAWETLKLLRLFPTASIVLKQELISIPIWGKFAQATPIVPIDRKNGKEALQKMLACAEQAKQEGRPIIIFPQGTRTPPGERHKYKQGIKVLFENLNISVLPIALNSGLFWPRNAFFKKSGIIDIEILPVIPSDTPSDQLLSLLKTRLEPASQRLAQKKQEKPKSKHTLLRRVLSVFVTVFLIHAALWWGGAFAVKTAIEKASVFDSLKDTRISGYPFDIEINVLSPEKTIQQPQRLFQLRADNIRFSTSPYQWPFDHAAFRIDFKNLTLQDSASALNMPYASLRFGLSNQKKLSVAGTLKNTSYQHNYQNDPSFVVDNIDFDIFFAPVLRSFSSKDDIRFWQSHGGLLNIRHLTLEKQGASAKITSHMRLDQNLQPSGKLSVSLNGSSHTMANTLKKAEILPPKDHFIHTLLSGFGINFFSRSQKMKDISVTAHVKKRVLRIGILPIYKFPEIDWNKLLNKKGQ